MPAPEFKFLEDKPLEELSSSKFGHAEIATILAKIVRNCPAPFTIGLFAKWGAGKSTVAFGLKKELPKEKIPVILFDVWKHEGDALRRTFLKETIVQLKEYGEDFFDTTFELDERIDQSITKSSESRFVFEWQKFKQLRPFIAPTLILLAAISYAAYSVGYLSALIQFLVTIGGFSGGAALVLWVLKQSLHLISSETTTFGADKFEDPHEFENEFVNILAQLKNPRILVIFDNLDRVTQEKVAEVLSTIKTFLEPEKSRVNKDVIFLIPCDARAIKEHLSNTYGSSSNYTFDADEFLRKFFNTILWIPDFIQSELETFAKDRLKETKVDVLSNDYVAWLITKAFRNNPRQIIQFVNILLANYLLVQEREGDGKDFPPDFLKDNIPQLTKYLVLNQLFPDEMEVLREQKLLNLEEVKEDDLKDTKSKDAKKTRAEFIKFIRETPTIPISNLRIFFTLRRSEQEKQFAGFDTFVALLEDLQLEESEKYFSQLGDFSQPDLIEAFSQAIKTALVEKINPVSLINLIYSLFNILDKNSLTLSSTAYEEIHNTLRDKCQEQIPLINPSLMDRVFLEKYAQYRAPVISQWVNVVETYAGGDRSISKETLDGIIGVFVRHPEYLTGQEATRFKTALSGSELPKDVEIAKIFLENEDAQKTFLGNPYVKAFVAGIPEQQQIQEITEKIKTINNFEKSVFETQGSNSMLEKITKIQTLENQRTPNPLENKEALATAFKEILSSHIDFWKTATPSNRDLIVTEMLNCFNAISPVDSQAILVSLLLEIRKFCIDSRIPDIDNAIGGFLTSVSSNGFVSMLANLPEDERVNFFELPFYVQAENRAVNDIDFRKEFYKALLEARKDIFVKRIFDSNFEQGLQFIESLGAEENESVFRNFNNVWPAFDNLGSADKKRILELVNARYVLNDSVFLDTLANKITNSLTTTDPALQEIGLNAFQGAKKKLGDLRNRQIAKIVFDWLLRPDIAKYQPPAIRAVFSEYTQFNDEEEGAFIQYVFDEFLRKTTDLIQVQFGFELLNQIKPTYKERKQNFDDVLARIKTETDPAIRDALIGGLMNLKPDNLSPDEEEFWKEVEEVKDGTTS